MLAVNLWQLDLIALFILSEGDPALDSRASGNPS